MSMFSHAPLLIMTEAAGGASDMDDPTHTGDAELHGAGEGMEERRDTNAKNDSDDLDLPGVDDTLLDADTDHAEAAAGVNRQHRPATTTKGHVT
ncbi:hypothetical protein [Deinococcus pimensis]|uniref:hypothetical protein n=1 Tax=Deinococcus pimensis TaxID=309888 RepID=UPI000485F133|nr:hypothetical protein [Deinococcus pimensis]